VEKRVQITVLRMASRAWSTKMGWLCVTTPRSTG